MISTLTRERRKIERNLRGIRSMNRLPEALMVVDPRREHIAVAEARKLGLKVVALLDTDCDPDQIDLPIPGNDDSMRSIELLLKRLTDAILEGRAAAPPEPPPAAEPAPGRGDRGVDRDRDRRRGPGRDGGGLRVGGHATPPAKPGMPGIPVAPAASAGPATAEAPPVEASAEAPGTSGTPEPGQAPGEESAAG
jgi:small subunit ribosomal protein S2